MNGNGQDRKKKRIWTALFILLNIAVIAATAVNEFSGDKAGSVRPAFSPQAPFFLGCIALCLAILFAAESLKYLLMMHSLREKLSLRVAFETAALGKYYDCITPSGAGGQPFQILWLHRHGYSGGASSAMAITGYITMQAGFILLAPVVFILSGSVELEAIRYTAWAGLFLFSLIPCLLVLFAFAPDAVKKIISAVIRLGARFRLVKEPEETTERVVGMLDSYHTSLQVIAKDKLTMLCLLVLSFIYRIALCSMPYFVLKMFGAPVSFAHIFAATVHIYASIALVPTPGNAGAAEGTFYVVFSAMGSGGVFWAMLVWRLFCHYSFIVTGAVVYGANALRRKREQKGEQA